MDASNYSECPECGSKHYKRSASRDITYTHEPGKPTKRTIDNLAGMPWHFDCLECGYDDTGYEGEG